MVWLYPTVKTLKIRFDRMCECDRQTDGQTDRQSETDTPHDGIDRTYA